MSSLCHIFSILFFSFCAKTTMYVTPLVLLSCNNGNGHFKKKKRSPATTFPVRSHPLPVTWAPPPRRHVRRHCQSPARAPPTLIAGGRWRCSSWRRLRPLRPAPAPRHRCRHRRPPRHRRRHRRPPRVVEVAGRPHPSAHAGEWSTPPTLETQDGGDQKGEERDDPAIFSGGRIG